MSNVHVNNYGDSASGSFLDLSFNKGHILLADQRMVLFHARAVGAMRKELINTLGIDRTRGLLTRMGFAAGLQDAELVRKHMPDATDMELMLKGPELHMLEGIVQVEPVSVDIDVAAGRYYGEFLWEDSFESEIYQKLFGQSDEPVCWSELGYASGFTTGIMQQFILYLEVECKAKGDEVCRIIGKPLDDWDKDEIANELRYYQPESVADQLVQLQSEVERLRYSVEEKKQLGDMVGQSESFQEACQLVEKAADSQVTILLLGETGVGKEMFARGLHNISNRADGPFIAINCAAIPEELIESELFGVEKGAYTGAQQSRPGRFERANGGTLFLDEVGELSASAQAKLLRVLQEGELERVGDTKTRKVDVRLVAATHVDLPQAVKDGRFRADLFYRLNIYPVQVPPLRQRKADIPLLVQRFLDKHSAVYGKPVTRVTERAMQALQAYEWPGNIRELENIIERGVILAGNDGVIDLPNLFHTISPQPEIPAEPATGTEVQRDTSASGGEASADRVLDSLISGNGSLEDLECRLLEAAVERCDGNLSSAARMLGMTRPQLAYRLKKKQEQVK